MASSAQYSTNLGLDSVPNPAEPKNFTDFVRIYNAIRALAFNLDALTGALQPDTALWSILTPQQTILLQNVSRLYLKFSDTVAAGEMCSIYDNAGVMTARKAGGAAWIGGDCKGFATAAVASGSYGELILFGLDTHVSGLTRGATYWMSNVTTGAFTATKPATNAYRVQPIGYALTDTTLFFNPSVLVPTLNVGTLAIPVLTP